MSKMEFTALLPLVIPAAAAFVVLLIIALKRNTPAVLTLTLLSYIGGFGTLFIPPTVVSAVPLLILDHYGRYFMGLIFIANFIVALLAYRYVRRYTEHREEFYLLLLLETFGTLVLVTSNHFASFFLGYEILSVSLYALLSYNRLKPSCVEAGLKYLVVSGVSSAFLLFGMALVYAELGTMMLPDIVGMIMQGGRMNLYILSGLSMIIVGIGFKLAWVPFHMWAADVYQGSPAPVTASLATVSKIAIFALLLRYFHGIPVRNYPALFWIFTLFAGFSMIIGNWLALMQRNVKRLLAYSSIAHFGYMLLPFLAGGQGGEAAVLFYLTAYTIATLGNFGVITILSDPGKETENWEEFSGLMWRRPALAAVFVLMILSLAGIPATIGFVGKIYMLFAGIDSALWALSILLVVGTSISFFYYLKLVILQFARGAADGQVQSGSGSAGALSATFSEGVVMAVLVGLLVVLGVYPTPLIRLIQLMVKVIG